MSSNNDLLENAFEVMDESLEGVVPIIDEMAVTKEEIQALQPEKESMPQLEFDTYPSQIFWLVVTFIALYLLISKSALPRIHEIVDKRKHRIERDLNRAEQLSEEALKAQKDYETVQLKARDKSHALIASVMQEIQSQHDVEQAKTDAKIVSMLSEADASILQKQQSFKEELTSLSEDLASALVEELTGKSPHKASLKSALSQYS